MVALALNERFKSQAKVLLAKLFRKTIAKSWMEVSEGAEKFMLKIGLGKFRVPNKYAEKLTKKEILQLCDDGYHYIREINGVKKKKMIIGFPKNF